MPRSTPPHLQSSAACGLCTCLSGRGYWPGWTYPAQIYLGTKGAGETRGGSASSRWHHPTWQNEPIGCSSHKHAPKDGRDGRRRGTQPSPWGQLRCTEMVLQGQELLHVQPVPAPSCLRLAPGFPACPLPAIQRMPLPSLSLGSTIGALFSPCTSAREHKASSGCRCQGTCLSLTLCKLGAAAPWGASPARGGHLVMGHAEGAGKRQLCPGPGIKHREGRCEHSLFILSGGHKKRGWGM